MKTSNLPRWFGVLLIVLASEWPLHAQQEGTFKLHLQPRGQEAALTWTLPTRSTLDETEQLLFDIQFSADLQNWSTIEELNVRAPNNAAVLLTRQFGINQPIGFYRVQTQREPAISFFTADSGADIFGLQKQFKKELAVIGEISVEAFASKFSPPGVPATITYNPTAGEFWDRFNTDIQVYNASRPAGTDPRLWDFRLNERELALFQQNGFVVSERLGAHSFAEVFYRIYTDDLPIYISSDAILQAWHRTFASILMELEATVFYSALEQLITRMHQALPRAWQEFGNGPLREGLIDADVFLSVALELLAGKTDPTPRPDRSTQAPGSHFGQQQFVDTTVQFIRDLRPRFYRNSSVPAEEFNLFGRRDRAALLPVEEHPDSIEFFDFSQFTLRGHYDQSPELARYFKTMMWLNRVDFRVAGPLPHASPRELGAALILSHLVKQSGTKNMWDQVRRLLVEMVGVNDYMTFEQLDDLIAAAGYTRLDQVGTVDDLRRIQNQINQGEIGVQQIRSHPYHALPLAKLPRSCAMGVQAFVVDGWAFSQVVFPDVRWKGNPALRYESSALDVAFSVLGNDHTVPWIVERIMMSPMDRRDGWPYQHNLAAVRRVIDQQDGSFWLTSIYSSWLGGLRKLSFPYSDLRLPSVMRTEAWQMKNLNTQLASWTHLKHDTLLYAKQPYSGTIICFYPHGYVEPVPEFYAHMERMVRRLTDLIAQVPSQPASFANGNPGSVWTQAPPTQLVTLRHFADVLQNLKWIAATELAGQDLDPVQLNFVRSLIESTSVQYVGTKRYSGWYPRLFYKNAFERVKVDGGDLDYQGSDRWDPLIADVQTAPQPPGSVLHEAVGNVHLILISIETPAGVRVYAGPVLSHYEFYVEGLKRKSDSDWKTELFGRASLFPNPPEWTQDYLIAHPIKLPDRAKWTQ